MPKKSAPPTHPGDGRVRLDPVDWYLATWRNLSPLPRPEAPPFDPKEALGRLAKIQPEWTHQTWDWDKGKIAPSLTREEAHFWLVAMLDTKVEGSGDLARRMAKQKFAGKLSTKQVAALFRCEPRYSARMLIPLSNLLTPAELARLLVENSAGKNGEFWARSWVDLDLAREYARVILPYLTEDDRAAVRDVVRPFTDLGNWTRRELGGGGVYWTPRVGTHLAALVGLHDELLALISSWPDGSRDVPFGDYWSWAIYLVFGLGDPRLVRQHVLRLKLTPGTPPMVRGWLAHTELSGLDVLRDVVAAQTNKKTAEQQAELLGQLVVAPELAPVMLDLQLNSKAAAAAGKWLAGHPDLAAEGLAPVAAGQGKLAEAAGRFLRDAGRKGQARGTPAAAAPAADDLPAWADPAVLPPLVVGKHALDAQKVRALLVALKKSEPGAPQPPVAAVKANGNANDLDAFAWRLFELWQGAGYPAKEKWALLALGQLGGDASVRKLVPLVRAWPGESQHARAVLGLEVLRGVGSDLALMQLADIAERLKFQALKARARQLMEEIARDKGLTPEQLEDRVVPTLGLDAGGGTFDFGPRQFRLVLGPGMKPMVRDDGGAVKADLPKPGKSDDAAKAADAVGRWKALKKQVAEVVKTQVARLERAMITGRRWAVPEFEQLVVKHPLMIHLAARLVWARYDQSGKQVGTFRVTEEGGYVDPRGKPCKPNAFAAVGVVHPVHLDEVDRSAWKRQFAAAGLEQPFAQLDRPVYRPEPKEAGGTSLTRFAEPRVSVAALRAALEKAGWVRGEVDQGAVEDHSLYFPGADVTAHVEYDPPLYLAQRDFGREKTHSLERIFFTPGGAGLGRTRLLRLRDVDPAALSEVLHWATALTTGK